MRHVAVSKNLSNVTEYLSSKGYNVEEFEGSAENACEQFHDIDAVVITGLEENVSGVEDTSTKASVINASGMTPEEIEKQIETRS